MEAITALLFALAALLMPIPTLFSVWVILSILVVTTFVDLEFFIIPDAMSKGGIVAGLLYLLLLIPCVVALWVPLFNSVGPELFGIPFFYWFQLLLVPVSALAIFAADRVGKA